MYINAQINFSSLDVTLSPIRAREPFLADTDGMIEEVALAIINNYPSKPTYLPIIQSRISNLAFL